MKLLVNLGLGLTILWLCDPLAPRTVAGIISSSGDVEIIAPPASVLKSALTHPTLARVFQERAGHVLLADLTVNMSTAGTTAGPPFPAIPTLTISAGTTIDSFFLHFDDQPNELRRSIGSLTFGRPIVGVIGRGADLIASNAALGATSTAYPTVAGSIGVWDSQDSVTISSDLLTLSFDLTASTGIDSMRIVTQPVPEPFSATLLSAVLILWLALPESGRINRCPNV
jgi:hypothetical protein